MSTRLEVATKGTLFAVAISAITGGSQLIRDNFYAGLAVLIVGVALIVIWAFLIDWQARREAREATREAFEKFKLELEGKKRE
jgi:Kef-type K+ transport system membrane component KefB